MLGSKGVDFQTWQRWSCRLAVDEIINHEPKLEKKKKGLNPKRCPAVTGKVKANYLGKGKSKAEAG